MINEIKQMLVYFLIYLIIYKLLINKFFFFRFLNTYNNKYSTSTLPTPDDFTIVRKKNTINTRLFKKRHRQNNTNEANLYFSIPSVSNNNVDPLEWWRINESQYPNLSRMARDYLSIPFTSVPLEQCFSLSKNLISDNK